MPVTKSIVAMILMLFAMHALCDYPLQGDFLAKGKNRHTAIPGIPWWHCLTAHALIHSFPVYLLTGSVTLALAELVIHWVTDFSKCEGWIGFNTDQAIHYGCKLLWVVLIYHSGGIY